jgi:DNA-binding response OmpR family regulator
VTEDQRVLIVDRSEEMHEVLETALARRGVRTYYARQARHGLEMAERIHPDLIVLDLELDATGPEAIQAPFARQSRKNQTPLVVLGSARRASDDTSLGEFVRKPYDYGPLVRKIEELLAHAKTCPRRAA